MTDTPYRLDPEFRAGRAKRRLVRIMACGVAAAKAAARLGITDEQLDAITADPDFPDLVEAYRRLYGKPEDEILKELRELAVVVLIDSVEERDPKACAWFFRELQHGRNPCVTLATSVVRAQERAAREAQQAEDQPPPPQRKRVRWPKPEYDDLEALRHRVTAALRTKLVVEAAALARDLAAHPASAPSEPPLPPPPAPPKLTRQPETETERDMRRVLAKIMGKKLRIRDVEPGCPGPIPIPSPS